MRSDDGTARSGMEGVGRVLRPPGFTRVKPKKRVCQGRRSRRRGRKIRCGRVGRVYFGESGGRRASGGGTGIRLSKTGGRTAAVYPRPVLRMEDRVWFRPTACFRPPSSPQPDYISRNSQHSVTGQGADDPSPPHAMGRGTAKRGRGHETAQLSCRSPLQHRRRLAEQRLRRPVVQGLDVDPGRHPLQPPHHRAAVRPRPRRLVQHPFGCPPAPPRPRSPRSRAGPGGRCGDRGGGSWAGQRAAGAGVHMSGGTGSGRGFCRDDGFWRFRVPCKVSACPRPSPAPWST